MERTTSAKNYAVVGLAIVIAGVAAFIGHVTSATEQYGSLLRFWAATSIIALMVLGWQAFITRGWFRAVCIGLMLVIVVEGVDPLRRMVMLGWSAP